VGHRAHLLTIDLADHVAALHARFAGSAALVDPRHDHAVVGLEVQLTRDLGRDRAYLEPERARRHAARTRRRLLVVRSLTDLDVDRLLALLTPDLHLGVVTWLRQADSALQVGRRLHL